MRRIDLSKRWPPKVEIAIFALLFLLFSFALGSFVYDKGWYPEREGLPNEMAAQVLRGNLPHRDFHDPGVGGADFFHAIAFSLGGPSLVVTRIALLATASISLLLAMLILNRSLTIGAAFGVVVCCLLWGPAVYCVPVPNWYGAFFAIIGAYALLRFTESAGGPWLLLAGGIGGIALTFHLLSGVLQILAAGLFLLYVDRDPVTRAPGRPLPLTAGLAVKAALIVAAVLGVLLIFSGPSRPSLILYLYLAPALLVACFLCLRKGPPAQENRPRSLAQHLPVYAAGLLLTLLPFLVPFAVRGGLAGLEALWQEAVVSAIRTADLSTDELPVLRDLLALLPLNALLLILYLLHRAKGPSWLAWTFAALAGGMLVFLVTRTESPQGYRFTWSMLRLLLPESVLFGIFLLFSAHRGAIGWTSEQRRRLALIVSFAACLNLLQLPECTGASFLFVFPFLMLLLGELVGLAVGRGKDCQGLPNLRAYRTTGSACLTFLIIFPWAYLVDSDARHFAKNWIPRVYQDQLRLDRAPIFTTQEDCRIYEGVAEAAEVCCPDPDGYIIAFPECQMVFFLTGRKNPFKTYGIRKLGDTSRWDAITAALHEKNVRVMVLDVHNELVRLFLDDPELGDEVKRFMPLQLRYSRFWALTPREPWDEVAKGRPTFGAERPRIRKKWPW